MQLGLMEAQKRNLEADAAKKEADAKKTAGADTEYTRMLTELAKTEIDYKAMSTEEVAAKIKMWGDKSQLLMTEARKAASEADYNEITLPSLMLVTLGLSSLTLILSVDKFTSK